MGAFDKKDLKEGNIGADRLKEIVKETLIKIDTSVFKKADLERINSALYDIAQKVFVFNKQYKLSENDVQDHFENEKRTHQRIFNKAILMKIEYLLIAETFLLAELKELETKAYLYNLERLERNHQEDVINEITLQQNIKNLSDEIKRLQLLLDERDRLASQLTDLLERRSNLEKLISKNKQDIIVIRKNLISNIISSSNNLTINDEKFFDGVSHKNIIKFANGYDALLAMKAKQYAKAEEAKANALENLTYHSSSATTSAFDLDKRRAKIDRVVIEAKEGFDEEFDINLRRLADQTGLKAAALSEPEFKDVMGKLYTEMDCDKTFKLLCQKFTDANNYEKDQEKIDILVNQTNLLCDDNINEINKLSKSAETSEEDNIEQDFEGLELDVPFLSNPISSNEEPISLDGCDSMNDLDFSGDFISVKKTEGPSNGKGPGSKNGNR